MGSSPVLGVEIASKLKKSTEKRNVPLQNLIACQWADTVVVESLHCKPHCSFKASWQIYLENVYFQGGTRGTQSTREPVCTLSRARGSSGMHTRAAKSLSEFCQRVLILVCSWAEGLSNTEQNFPQSDLSNSQPLRAPEECFQIRLLGRIGQRRENVQAVSETSG